MACYVDTSARVKLVVAETEIALVSKWIATESTSLMSSDLARTQLLRADAPPAPNPFDPLRAGR